MDAIERLGPWMYEFEFADGTKTPLLAETLRPIHAARRAMIFDFLDALGFERAVSVLDLACSEGFFSFEFAKRGATSVRGIDARARNIEKADLVRDRLGLTSCRFETGDITEVALDAGGADVVLLLGIVYHVEDPIRLMRRAAAASRKLLFVETQLTKPMPPVQFTWGSPAVASSPDAWGMVRENPAVDDLSATRGFSLVPNASAVVSVLRDIGFRSIAHLHPNARESDPQFEFNDRGVFVASW